MRASKLKELKELRDLGVSSVHWSLEGNLMEVSFHPPDENAPLVEYLKEELAKTDADYQNLTDEERQERLMYGHTS